MPWLVRAQAPARCTLAAGEALTRGAALTSGHSECVATAAESPAVVPGGPSGSSLGGELREAAARWPPPAGPCRRPEAWSGCVCGSGLGGQPGGVISMLRVSGSLRRLASRCSRLSWEAGAVTNRRVPGRCRAGDPVETCGFGDELATP